MAGFKDFPDKEEVGQWAPVPSSANLRSGSGSACEPSIHGAMFACAYGFPKLS